MWSKCSLLHRSFASLSAFFYDDDENDSLCMFYSHGFLKPFPLSVNPCYED